MLSQSTSCASNSGPSTQANLISPPTVTRHPPHMPVPSIMMGFREAIVGIPSSLVRRDVNFIMRGGPMTTAWSMWVPPLTRERIASVTSPLVPHDPSSVVTMSSSLTCLLYTSDAADDLLCVDLGGRR